MNTLVAVGRSKGHQYTMEITHTLPLSAAWLAANDAALVPSYANDFATGVCACDSGDRCDNHDDQAQQKFWAGQFVPAPTADPDDQYERTDPKTAAYVERLSA